MQKIYLFLVAFAVTATVARAQVVLDAAHFPDASFRGALASKLSVSEGSTITAAQIAATTSLDVSSKNIADLKGVEYFTALEELHCYNNQLTTLDVSACTALKRLGCYGNRLTTLNVSGCVDLEGLYCDRNELTALDVSTNTKLEQLWCYNNQLSALDVSTCTSLLELYCNFNQISELDVTHCPQLYSFACVSNRLSTLDLSNNTVLQFFYCHTNQIKGEGVRKLVKSLPVFNNIEFDFLYPMGDNEANEMEDYLVEMAKAKGWIPKYYDNGWKEYAGVPTDITVTNLPQEPKGNAARHGLGGQRAGTSYKGIVIENGRKVVVK